MTPNWGTSECFKYLFGRFQIIDDHPSQLENPPTPQQFRLFRPFLSRGKAANAPGQPDDFKREILLG